MSTFADVIQKLLEIVEIRQAAEQKMLSQMRGRMEANTNVRPTASDNEAPRGRRARGRQA